MAKIREMMWWGDPMPVWFWLWAIGVFVLALPTILLVKWLGLPGLVVFIAGGLYGLIPPLMARRGP